MESLPSVEENSVEEISNNNNIPLEYLSLKLVKETFGRVLSDQALQLEKERSACAEADECLVTGTDEIIENCTNTNEIGNQNFISSPDKSPQSSPTQTDHLYSSSSTHLCAKLTETLHSTADVGAATEPAAENPVRYLFKLVDIVQYSFILDILLSVLFTGSSLLRLRLTSYR